MRISQTFLLVTSTGLEIVVFSFYRCAKPSVLLLPSHINYMEGKKVPILIMFTLNNVGKVERCNWIHLSTLSSQKVTWAVHIIKSKIFAVQIYACLIVNQRGFSVQDVLLS